MQKITPFLWFDDQAEEAMNFYVGVFKNSKVGNVTRYGDAGPGPKGSVMTASFELEGQQFTALNGGPRFKFTEAVSFVVSCETQDEVDELWERAFRRRPDAAMRLAVGQVRPLVADRSHRPDGADERPRPEQIAKGHGSDAPDDQDRHRQAEAGLRGLTGVDPNSPG